MRKYFLYATMLAVFAFISCEKLSVSSDDDGEGFADITFSLKTVVSDYTTRATLSETKITKFDFAIFYYKNETYTLYDKIEQDSTDASFGVISLKKVPYGTYKVVAIGHKCGVHAIFDSVTDVNFGGGVNEAFTATSDITVNAESGSYNLTLKRITSKFVLQATDTQPGTVASLDFVITGSSKRFDPSTGLSSTTEERTSITNTLKGIYCETPDYSTNMLLPSAEAKVTIVANFKDKDGKIVLTKTFENVTMKQNCVTTFEGELFSSLTNTGGFSFSVDDSWGSPTTIKF